MALSDTEIKVLLSAFLASVANLGTGEQKLMTLFAHTLKSPAEQTAEREGWLQAQIDSAADTLNRLDANTATQRQQLQRGIDDFTLLRDSLPLKA